MTIPPARRSGRTREVVHPPRRPHHPVGQHRDPAPRGHEEQDHRRQLHLPDGPRLHARRRQQLGEDVEPGAVHRVGDQRQAAEVPRLDRVLARRADGRAARPASGGSRRAAGRSRPPAPSSGSEETTRSTSSRRSAGSASKARPGRMSMSTSGQALRNAFITGSSHSKQAWHSMATCIRPARPVPRSANSASSAATCGRIARAAREQPLAGGRELQRLRALHEERRARLLLDPADPVRQRRLRQSRASRRPARGRPPRGSPRWSSGRGTRCA